MAKVVLTKEAMQQEEELPKTILDRVKKVYRRLEHWPDVSGIKALTGDLAGWYRIRTGDYRIRFFLKGDKVVVDKLGQRKDFYES